jgi:hypothetical protein
LESNSQVAETDVVVDQINRERIMESLFDPARVIDRYVIDQNRYIQKFSNMGELEQDSRYFWIFRDMDYEKWTIFDENAKVLELCGSSILECAASQVIRTLQKNQDADLLLHFFFRSKRHAKPLGNRLKTLTGRI